MALDDGCDIFGHADQEQRFSFIVEGVCKFSKNADDGVEGALVEGLSELL